MARIVIIETNDAAELQAITTELKIHSIFSSGGDTVVVKDPPKPKEKPATQVEDRTTKEWMNERKQRLHELYEEEVDDNPTATKRDILRRVTDRFNDETKRNFDWDEISESTTRRILNE